MGKTWRKTSEASKECFCHGKSKEERKVILLSIRESKIEEEIVLVEPGKFSNLRKLVPGTSILDFFYSISCLISHETCLNLSQ